MQANPLTADFIITLSKEKECIVTDILNLEKFECFYEPDNNLIKNKIKKQKKNQETKIQLC